MLWSVTVVLLGAVMQLTNAYPFEVAKKACENMLPQGPAHGHMKSQETEIPFEFSQDKKSISNSESVEITISQRAKGPMFAAFMVQGRQGSATTPVGTFQPKGDNARTIACTSDNDTGSHNSPDPKKSVTLIWSPPTNFKGTVTLYCTVAETKLKFWAKQKCGTVTVK